MLVAGEVSLAPIGGRSRIRFPGCCNRRYIDGHSIRRWANGGETKLGNLITLCYFHHRLVHEGGWDVKVLDDGAFRFLKPNGEVLNGSCDQSGSLSCPLIMTYMDVGNGGRVGNNEHPLITLHPSPPAQWRGDKMDYGLAVQILIQREARARRAGEWCDLTVIEELDGRLSTHLRQSSSPKQSLTKVKADVQDY